MLYSLKDGNLVMGYYSRLRGGLCNVGDLRYDTKCGGVQFCYSFTVTSEYNDIHRFSAYVRFYGGLEGSSTSRGVLQTLT